MKKLWNLKITPYKSGQLAEFVCRLYMRLHGYRIIAKNYKCGSGKKTSCGELDFVAAKGKRIVFCEVKKRKRSADFLYALSYKQQQRIMRGGEYFMKMHCVLSGRYRMLWDCPEQFHQRLEQWLPKQHNRIHTKKLCVTKLR